MFLRLFFVGEIVLCGWLYLYGVESINLNNATDIALQEHVKDITDEIEHLEKTIAAWTKYPTYYKEKEARERLQMAHRQDIIYLL